MAHQLTADQIVSEYLSDLSTALRAMPSSGRRDFVADIAQHIEQSRSLLVSDDPTAIQGILDRLGTPGDLANEVLSTEPAIHVRDLDKATPWLLALGGLIAGVGWLFGLYGMWTSKVWRPIDRILGSLIWPIFVISVFWSKGNSDGSVCSGGARMGSCGGLGLSFALIIFVAFGVGIFFRLLWILYRTR